MNNYLHNIKAAIDAGYTLCVIDAESQKVVTKTRNPAKAQQAVEQCDVAEIQWQTEATCKKVADFLIAQNQLVRFSKTNIAQNWYDDYLQSRGGIKI